MESLTLIKPDQLFLNASQTAALMPYFVLLIGSCIALLACTIRKFSPKFLVLGLSTLTLALAGYFTLGNLEAPTVEIFNRMMVSDRYSTVVNLIFIASGIVTILGSAKYLDREDLQYPEYYLLILFSVFGMMMLASARDLIVLFIALEVMSLSVYSLVGFRRSDRLSNEAAMKYFILGGAASALLLYGSALLYGATMSTQIGDILSYVKTTPVESLSRTFSVGAWLVIVGFMFKIASVPFHMWMPDVYEGAPAPVTGFMTTGLKAAAFASFVRVFSSLGYGSGFMTTLHAHIHDILWVCAVLTMVLGNVIALSQTNLKRMLAYSSIAHTGYLLVGILAGPSNVNGFAPVLLYLISYSVMNMGAFIVLTMMSQKGDTGLTLHELSGMSQRHPWLAFAMAAFLFSMAGIPPTAGFIAKYLLFYSAVQAGEVLLVVVSVLCSAVSVYYYLRVLVFMYMRDATSSKKVNEGSLWAGAAVAAMVWLTLQIGLLPSHLLESMKKTVLSLV